MNDRNLKQYFEEINNIPLLSREDEIKIAQQAAKGDTEAKEKLIQANLRFVVQVAKKYQDKGLPLEDLINEGNIGLIHAADRFDPDKGYHFISYAVWWIKQSILKAFNEKVKHIRLPSNRVQELLLIQKSAKELETHLGRPATEEELAKQTGYPQELVHDLLAISQPVSTLNHVGEEKKELELADTRTPSPEDSAMDKHLKKDINKVLRILSDRESEILQYRFGLNNKQKHSLKELGDQYNLTKERIRQIEKEALRKLQQSPEARELRAYSFQ